MSTRRKFTKYLMIIAIIAMSTMFLGCEGDVNPPIAVTSVTVTGAASATTVAVDSTLQMSAAVLPADASDKSVTWSVEAGTGTATISTTGLLTGTTAGTVTVKAIAKDGSAKQGTSEITVETVPILVTGITVTGAGGAIVVMNGLTLQMNAAILPADASNPSVTWTVDAGTGAATISAMGLLTGSAEGTVTVTAIAKDGSAKQGTKVITVTASILPSSPLKSYALITLVQTGDVANNTVQYKTAAAVITALPKQISVTLENETAKMVPLSWTDTDTYNPATAANYTFTATWGAMPVGANNDNNVVAPTIELIVTQGVLKVTEITVTATGAVSEVIIANPLQMIATVIPAEVVDKTVIWSVLAGTGTATINPATGVLTGTKAGTVTVKATAKDSPTISGIKVITITEPILLTSPLASFVPLTLTQTGDVANNTVQYKDAAAVIAALPTEIAVTLADATVKTVPLSWADTDTYNKAVAADYTFTAIWGAMPSGANNDNSLAVPTVEVNVKAGVVLIKTIAVTGLGNSIEVLLLGNLQMIAVVLPDTANDKTLTWTVTAGTGTATISETGVLTGTAVGTVTVRATANDPSGILGTRVITVTEPILLTSPLASFAALTLTQTGDVANNTVQYKNAAEVMLALPAEIEVTLVDASKKIVPLSWADTDTYNPAIAADYTFTAIWGAMPAGADNTENLAVPTVEVKVVAGVLLVTKITVTAAEEKVEVLLLGDLQMNAEVLPIAATDPSITWSVVVEEGPGKGKATISQTGLLTGTAVGTVIVKATANDSSAVEGTMEITVNSNPIITATFPEHLATGVAITTNIEASFNEEMDPFTILDPLNFTISGGVTGIVTYDALTKTATFNPDDDLLYNTEYTATVTTGVKDLSGLAMVEDKVWTFTTATEVLAGVGPALINIRSASNFAILAKTAITNTGGSLITGNIGVSPQVLAGVTGFAQTLSDDSTFATSIYVTEKIYSADMSEPTPSTLTTAISDVEAAYTEAAGRVDYAVTAGAFGGIIGGQTFAPGIYKWETVVTMATDITLQGGTNDAWIFQVADDLTASTGAQVLLADGAQAKNVFWQVGGIVALRTGAHLEGIIMGMTQIVLEAGSSVHGKLFAQSQVTLDTATVTPL